MQEDAMEAGPSTGHRASVKQGSGGSWRDKLREDCRRLVRERRQQTLQRHRQSLSPLSPAQLQSALQSDVHAAVHDALLGIQRPPLPTPQAPALSPSTPSTGDTAAAALGSGNLAAAVGAAADVDGLLAELEREMVAEMLAELEQLEAFDAAELAAAVADHEAFVAAAAAGDHSSAAAASAAMQNSSGGPESLLCPICMGAFLLQRAGVVVCPRGCLQLNLAAESLSLADLRARLGAAYEEHSLSGCSGGLAFRVEELFGTRSLTGGCSGGCAFYRVVA